MQVDSKNDLIAAVHSADPKEIESLLSAMDINYADEKGVTALIEASYLGKTNIVKLLLSIPNININQANYLGETALMQAVIFNHKEIVKLLLARPEVNVHQENIFHYSAVHMAYLHNKRKDIIQLFAAYQLLQQSSYLKTALNDMIEMAGGQAKHHKNFIEEIFDIDKKYELSGNTCNNAED